MFSRLFGKSKSHQAVLQVNLQRISFLMEYLQQCALKDKDEVVSILNQGLMLGIPNDISDPEHRHWPDPSNDNFAISFGCFNSDTEKQVTQVCITGFNDIANTLIIGTANKHKNGKLMWRVSPESDARKTPALSRIIQKSIWEMPGWSIGGLKEYQYLEKE